MRQITDPPLDDILFRGGNLPDLRDLVHVAGWEPMM